MKYYSFVCLPCHINEVSTVANLCPGVFDTMRIFLFQMIFFAYKELKVNSSTRQFIDMTMHCISSPSMRILWSGEALEEFKPSR